MAAPVLPFPLEIDKRADFEFSFQLQTARVDVNGLQVFDDAGQPLGDPIVLTGATVVATMQFRETAESPVVLLELTNAPGEGITVDLATGTFTIAIGADVTGVLEWAAAVTDLFVSVDGDDDYLFSAKVVVNERVTHA